MGKSTGSVSYKDRAFMLAVIGVLLLFVGMDAAFLGPLEMYCFYLFSEGGRFHYEGFGFGSFMFGNITCQIVGYYLIAVVCIPLGYGHLRLRRWARVLTLTLLWFWIVVGMPLIVVFFLMLVTAKDMSLLVVPAVIAGLLISYFILPGLLIRFYRSRDVRLTFSAKDYSSHSLERLPMPVLVLCSLYAFYIIALHAPILFNGIFPFFGVFMFDIWGIFLADILIVCLACLIWGTLRLRAWAWWGALVYFGLMTISSTLTLSRSSYLYILLKMKFAPKEIDALDGLPLQGFHLAIFVGIPLIITLGVIVLSKRCFPREAHA